MPAALQLSVRSRQTLLVDFYQRSFCFKNNIPKLSKNTDPYYSNQTILVPLLFAY
ncbi:MAG: hypothetical protein ACI88A_002824 [Paraglaciecola sp.]|jgi:hypothetical protein